MLAGCCEVGVKPFARITRVVLLRELPRGPFPVGFSTEKTSSSSPASFFSRGF
jgi:hypothetical protein